jgi:hypothetical protein
VEQAAEEARAKEASRSQISKWWQRRKETRGVVDAERAASKAPSWWSKRKDMLREAEMARSAEEVAAEEDYLHQRNWSDIYHETRLSKIKLWCGIKPKKYKFGELIN